MPLSLDRHRPPAGGPGFSRRLGWMVGFVVLAFLVMIGRLWHLQVVHGDTYFQRTTNNFVKEQWIPAVRGRILDRHGRVLADNRPAFNVHATPRYYDEEVHQRLVDLLDLGDEQADHLWSRVERARERDKARSVLLFEDVSWERLALIEQNRALLPGLEVVDVPHRTYPMGTLAAHVLGYMNEISESELERRREEGYEPGDYVGRYGIEREWENYLRGKRGVERFVVDARGRRLGEAEDRELIRGERFIAPIPGNSVVLTLDAELQAAAEDALRNHPAGAVAVVEVNTGRILALVSRPAFDPNVMTGGLSRAELLEMEADIHKPFVDKTLRQHYFPGSTFKFVTAVAALEDGHIDPGERITCKGAIEVGGRRFRCNKVHGSVSLYEALAQSCNVYFWHLAQEIGLDRIAQTAVDFGFGSPTGLGLNGDVPGHVPFKAYYEQKRGGYLIGYALNTAIGQGDTTVTVMQLALAYAAVANGGRLYVPQIVERIETAGGEPVVSFEPRVRRKIQMSQRTLFEVQHGLWGVVNDERGTSYRNRLPDVEVAGKTGTAQVKRLNKKEPDIEGWHPEKDHAWFAGYAPAGKPEIAVAVLVEHGGGGGKVAAPVAMEIIQTYFQRKTLARAPEGAPLGAKEAP